MELFREKERELIIETKLTSEEVIKRLSQNMVKPMKWYSLLLPFEEDRPYAGEIIGKKFKASSLTEPITLRGEIEEMTAGTLIKIKVNPEPIIRSNYIHGTMVSFIAGMGAIFITVLGGLMYFVDLKPNWFLTAATFLGLTFGLITMQYYKHYKQKLQDRIDINIEFIKELLKK